MLVGCFFVVVVFVFVFCNFVDFLSVAFDFGVLEVYFGLGF